MRCSSVMVASTRTAHSAVGVGVGVAEKVGDGIGVVVSVAVGVGLAADRAHDARRSVMSRNEVERCNRLSIAWGGPWRGRAKALRTYSVQRHRGCTATSRARCDVECLGTRR